MSTATAPKLYSYEQHRAMLAETIATFPGLFTLPGFPGDLCRVSASSSYFATMASAFPTLYVERLTPHGWSDLAKATPSELRYQIAPAQITIDVAQKLRTEALRMGDWDMAALCDFAADGNLHSVPEHRLTIDWKSLNKGSAITALCTRLNLGKGR